MECTLSCRYVVDELGSRIGHSRTPNFRLVPFCRVGNLQTYSLLFPIEDVEEDGLVTRNYIEGPPTDEETTNALLLPWYDFDFRHLEFHQTEPDEEFFQGGRHLESLPEDENDSKSKGSRNFMSESAISLKFIEYMRFLLPVDRSSE